MSGGGFAVSGHIGGREDMRIIGGTARGKGLAAPEGMDTRPTSDRTREALFNILMMRVPGARVLDLFAGSGALSAEALSRGAANAVCVDISPEACRVIRKNLDLKGIEGTSEIMQADWQSALGRIKGEFDIVFLDPPYRMTEVYGQAFSEIVRRGLLAQDGVAVMEYEQGASVPLPECAEIYDERKYGKARVMLVRARRDEGGAER